MRWMFGINESGSGVYQPIYWSIERFTITVHLEFSFSTRPRLEKTLDGYPADGNALVYAMNRRRQTGPPNPL